MPDEPSLGVRRAGERRSYDDIVQLALRPIPRGRHRAGAVAREQRRRRQESAREGSRTPESPRRRLPAPPKPVTVLGAAACLAVAAAVAIPGLDTYTYAAGDRSSRTAVPSPDRITAPQQAESPSPEQPRPPAASRRATPEPQTAPERTATPERVTVPERTRKPTPRAQIRTPRVDTAEWEAWVDYRTDAVVTYDGMTYRCRRGHTAQVGWEPPIVPALWEPITRR